MKEKFPSRPLGFGLSDEESSGEEKKREEDAEKWRRERLKAAEKIIIPIIDPNREVPEEYQHLISRAELAPCKAKARYSEFWSSFFKDFNTAPQAHNFFRKHLKDYPLVDLGGGEGGMEILARESGAPMYINVDKYSIDINSERKDRVIRVLKISQDILKFVAQVRDNSANFILNGIDDFVIEDFNYHQALAREIERATGSGGIIFGVNSQIDYIFKQKINNEKTSLEPQILDLHIPGNLFIYKKR